MATILYAIQRGDKWLSYGGMQYSWVKYASSACFNDSLVDTWSDAEYAANQGMGMEGASVVSFCSAYSLPLKLEWNEEECQWHCMKEQ